MMTLSETNEEPPNTAAKQGTTTPSLLDRDACGTLAILAKIRPRNSGKSN
jgi:hypothetical protein